MNWSPRDRVAVPRVRLTSPRHAQRFSFTDDGPDNLFHRHRPRAEQERAARVQAFQAWAEGTGIARLASPSERPVHPMGRLALKALQVDSAGGVASLPARSLTPCPP